MIFLWWTTYIYDKRDTPFALCKCLPGFVFFIQVDRNARKLLSRRQVRDANSMIVFSAEPQHSYCITRLMTWSIWEVFISQNSVFFLIFLFHFCCCCGSRQTRITTDVLVQCNQYRVSLYPAGLFLPYTIFFFFKQTNKTRVLNQKWNTFPLFSFTKSNSILTYITYINSFFSSFLSFIWKKKRKCYHSSRLAIAHRSTSTVRLFHGRPLDWITLNQKEGRKNSMMIKHGVIVVYLKVNFVITETEEDEQQTTLLLVHILRKIDDSQ